MKNIHMMIGIPGSGKSTFASKLGKEKNYKIVSTDNIRKDNISENDVWIKVYDNICNILKDNDDCIFDATNITKKVRDRFINNLQKKIREFNLYGYYMPTFYKECVKRVELRNKDKDSLYLPISVIYSYNKSIYPPTYEENFKKSYVITQKRDLLQDLVDDAYQGYGLYYKSMTEEIEEYSGFTNINTTTKIEDITNFRLASVTKQFIAYGIMTLIEDNKLSFDDSLFDMFDDMPDYTRNIYIKNLLNHTSGLYDYEDIEHYDENDPNYKQIKDYEVLEFVKKTDKGYFKCGEKYRYSNTAYVILGLIIEKRSNLKLGEYLKINIFDKFDMSNTQLNYEGITNITNRAYGHIEINGKLEMKDQYWCSATLGDGGIYSSVNDLKKWLKVIENLSGLYRKMVETNYINSIDIQYGFGLRVKSIKQYKLIYHCGDTIGTSTLIGYIRDDNDNIVYEFIFLTNKSDKDTSIFVNNLVNKL